MMRVGLILVLAVLGACSPPDPAAQREAAFKRALAEATSTARAHLDYFWTHWAAPEATEYDFRVKIKRPRADGTPGPATAWIEHLLKSDDALSGEFAAPAPELGGKNVGDGVTFKETEIVDWAFFRGEKLYGHYTTRVMLPRLPTDQADVMRSMLGDNPR